MDNSENKNKGAITQIEFMNMLMDGWYEGRLSNWSRDLANQLQAKEFEKLFNKVKRQTGPFKIRNYKRKEQLS